MKLNKDKIVILIADDDDDDYFLIKKALKDCPYEHILKRVADGEELMEYLTQSGRYSDPESCPKPFFIMLDLNMPKKDGREALKEIKGDPELRKIPVTILTTSEADEDILKTYDLGVNSFITKPPKLETFIRVVQDISDYWLNTVQLPKPE